MRIIEMGGCHLGVNCNDAYFIRPDMEEEKCLLAELIKKLQENIEHPVEELPSPDDHPSI